MNNEFSTFVNSLKRLLEANKITKAHVTNLLEKGKIAQDEYNYIVGADIL